MEDKVAIIDPVGIKSGMNHYDTFLCNSLTKQEITPFIYSNFEVHSDSVIAKRFFGTFFKNKFSQTLNFLMGMLKSCMDCRRNNISKVIDIFVKNLKIYTDFGGYGILAPDFKK